MSAIFGIMRWNGGTVDARELDRMGRTMAHRAPDGIRAAALGEAGLGHGLMRITREDLFEAQPVQDSTGAVTMVADARIDNRDALAQLLGIATTAPDDMPDSALMIAAYQRWGDDFPAQLIGDFAFALWDSRRRVLLVGRDHMGQRPLYYHHGDGQFVFATEAKALWAIDDVPRRINQDQLGRQLLMTIDRFGSETVYAGISILRGGMTLAISPDGVARLHPYWEPQAAPVHIGRDDAYYLATYKCLVEEAIACRVSRLTRPPGLNFSGGIDSSMIAVVAGPIAAARGHKIMATSCVRAQGDSGDRDARAMAAAYRDRPYLDLVLHSRGDETMLDDLETYWAFTEVAGSMNYPQRAMFRSAAERGARLVMDGHGGDYTVNRREPAMLGRILRRGDIDRFLREFRHVRARSGASMLQILRNDVLPALTPLAMLRRQRERATWPGKPPAVRAQRFATAEFADRLFAHGIVDARRLRLFGMRHLRWDALQMATLRRMMTMAPGYESIAAWQGTMLTRPFHDKRIVEFALALPPHLLFRNGASRYLARQLFGDRLAPTTLERLRGNDTPYPDAFDMALSVAPRAIADAHALAGSGRGSTFVDLDKAAARLKAPLGKTLGERRTYLAAIEAVVTARFVAWFERSNE